MELFVHPDPQVCGCAEPGPSARKSLVRKPGKIVNVLEFAGGTDFWSVPRDSVQDMGPDRRSLARKSGVVVEVASSILSICNLLNLITLGR